MKSLKFYGVGGQGIVTAGKILSIAVSLHEDNYAITVPAYGHERRGAPVYTDVVLDDKPILQNCFVYQPDIVMIMDETIVEKNVDIAKGTTPETILVLNASCQEVLDSFKSDYNFKTIYYVNATQIAIDTIGKNIPNSTSLGALAKTGVVSIEAIEKAIKDFFGSKGGEINAKAARCSYEQTKQL